MVAGVGIALSLHILMHVELGNVQKFLYSLFVMLFGWSSIKQIGYSHTRFVSEDDYINDVSPKH